MENLEQQLQQLRLIHNRITSNDLSTLSATASAAPSLPGQTKTTTAPTTTPQYKSIYGYGKKTGSNSSNCCDEGRSLSSSSSRWNGMGLDNPIVLDQQLEALAHHKRQMEKRGLLQNQQQQQHIETFKNNRFKGMHASLFGLNDEKLKKHAVAYATNIVDNDVVDNDDDNETSPPSPVSSSYSELRHAAESSSSLTSKQQQQHHHHHHHHHTANIGAATYMNVAYGPNSCCSPNAGITVTKSSSSSSSSTAAVTAAAAASASSLNNQDANTDYYDFGNFSQVN